MAAGVNPEVGVAKLLSGLYLPETTFATKAIKVDNKIALVTHTLTKAQCAPRKSEMLRGDIRSAEKTIINTLRVDGEITKGHFKRFTLLAGHQGFGMLLAAGSYDQPMWWTGVSSINWQSPAAKGDEMVAIAIITQEDDRRRVINGKVMRDSLYTHTRARGIQLEKAKFSDFSGFYLPQNAWLEVGAHFAGGAIAALGKFPGKEFAPIYLGAGESVLAKELGLPGDNLAGTVTLNSTEDLEVPNLGRLTVVSLDVEISKGTAGRWTFKELELGFANRARLMEAIRQR